MDLAIKLFFARNIKILLIQTPSRSDALSIGFTGITNVGEFYCKEVSTNPADYSLVFADSFANQHSSADSADYYPESLQIRLQIDILQLILQTFTHRVCRFV